MAMDEGQDACNIIGQTADDGRAKQTLKTGQLPLDAALLLERMHSTSASGGGKPTTISIDT